jgi:RND family efflux transporter MFP subunit
LLAAAGGRAAAEPPEVAVCHPVVREVTDFDDFTGRIEAVQTVELRARVSGYLDKIFFKEGALVKRGDLLFEIDPRPYRAELDKAEAEVLRSESRLKRATADLERLKALLARAAIAREEVDRIEADRTESQAAVVAARAAMNIVRLNLEFTRVTAPISGRIGRTLLDVGNVVRADTTHLATLVSVDPVYVTFAMDERTYLRRAGHEPDAKLTSAPVGIALANESGWPHQGKFESADTAVDSATGTLRCRAALANPAGVMLPGMFARVRLAAGVPYKALLVPERVVGRDQGQPFVWVVGDRDVVEKRAVTLGTAHDGLRAITAGLKTEDRVAAVQVSSTMRGKSVKPKLVEIPATGSRPE